MRFVLRPWLVLVVLALTAGTWAVAQTTLPPPSKGTPTGPKVEQEVLPPPPPASAVAATVNGQPITELAVYRLRVRGNPNAQESRDDILNFLVETMLVDQFVAKFNISVTPQEVEQKVEQMRKEALADKTTLEEILRKMFLSTEELRDQLKIGRAHV